MDQLVDIPSYLGLLVLIGLLTESILELLKTAIFSSTTSKRTTYITSIIVGLILAFVLNVSLFKIDNLGAYYIGIVISGLVASRGSNYAHEFVDRLKASKTK